MLRVFFGHCQGPSSTYRITTDNEGFALKTVRFVGLDFCDWLEKHKETGNAVKYTGWVSESDDVIFGKYT
jgi:hypothetical protein